MFRAMPVTYINSEGVGLKIAAERADSEWIPEHVLRDEWTSVSEYYLLESIWLHGLHASEWAELGDGYRHDSDARARMSFLEYMEEHRPRGEAR